MRQIHTSPFIERRDKHAQAQDSLQYTPRSVGTKHLLLGKLFKFLDVLNARFPTIPRDAKNRPDDFEFRATPLCKPYSTNTPKKLPKRHTDRV